MPTFNAPATDADELREAARGLAHATRSLGDLTEIYAVLGSISSALASMSQTLHQLGAVHDNSAQSGGLNPAQNPRLVHHTAYADRAASYQESWELHRAAEMIHQVAACVDRAHQIEATIAYDTGEPPSLAPAHRPSSQPGLSL
ncbi:MULTISPECIES: hypothetical protein [unclassified Nocardioides]|uniref:hypothetical protein n=1 Tax=unclassified Nocardioides TaxID=2615069 RepID=UPI0006F46DD9|nr:MULTISPECIES: hypothetical protein [unclassified Nocardioides]KRA30980.1 hypothetical protein ASD81_15890 [Nocardioides sp. Root614]KRA87601.1 hypothetical protein ASD84_16165 [Nocardioides sp. Root682]